MPTYHDYTLANAPPWLLQPQGAAFLEVLGLMKDGLTQAGLDAVRNGSPLLCAEDALPPLARERGLERMPWHQTADFRAYLANAPAIWAKSGTYRGVCDGVADTHYVPLQNITVGQPATPTPAPYGAASPRPSFQTWPSLAPFTFVLVLYGTPWLTGGPVTDGTLFAPTSDARVDSGVAYLDGGTMADGGGIIGTSASANAAALVGRQIGRFSTAGTLCLSVVIVLSGNPPIDGTAWQTPSSWGTGPGGVNGDARYWLPTPPRAA